MINQPITPISSRTSSEAVTLANTDHTNHYAVTDRHNTQNNGQKAGIVQKIKGGVLLVVGYMLSPLCWWNDLIINLPIAYGFGYVVAMWQADWFFGAAIVGYWLSNLVGIVLMQMGTKDILQTTAKKRSFQQEIFAGVLTSTAYTAVIVALVYFHVLDLNTILPLEVQL